MVQTKYSLLILFLLSIIKASSQEVRMPTAPETETFKKNFQTILQQVPSHFEKIKTNDSLDFFGTMSYASSVKLLPNEAGAIKQNIFYITEKDGKTIKAYTELLPFTLETCIDMLGPLLKLNAFIEVATPRAGETTIARSFRNKNAVVEIIAANNNSPVNIAIGKIYYYYTADVKPLTGKIFNPVIKTNTNKTQPEGNNTVDAKKSVEEKITKGLTVLYKSAINTVGSYNEFKTGPSKKIGNTEIYDLSGQLRLDSIQNATLFSINSSEGINGIAADVAPAITPVYINVLNKMAKSVETAGEIIVEKKMGVTRYSLLSKSFKKEVFSLLDFDNRGYADKIICYTINIVN